MKKVNMICLLLIHILFFSACNFKGWHLKISDATAIAEIYYEHEDLFQTVAETLIPYTEKQLTIVTCVDEPDYERYVYYKAEELYLYTLKERPLSEAECNRIYDIVYPLFEVYDLEHITSWHTWVAFRLESKSGQCAELFYEPNGKKVIPSFGVVDELQINKYWYAVTSSD